MNLSILNKYVEDGLLRKAEDDNLVQYNYSEFCNNTAAWDDITLCNRGNIYEKSSGKLIAKSMPKFFNFSQLSEEDQKHFIRSTKFVNTEKMDGCLGIIYKYKGELRCNSRGGFDNYVTDVMKRLLPKYNLEKLNEILDNNSLNVEVISPETKIICDYGNEENLYLISAFINLKDYWQERSCDELDLFSNLTGLPRPKYNNMTWTELFNWQKTASYEKEGFVVMINSEKYGAFQRVKIKSEDYLKIAKIRASFCKHTIWKLMKNDLEQHTNTLNDYVNNVPDELSKTAQRYINEIKEEVDKYYNLVAEYSEHYKDVETRDLYKVFKEDPVPYQSAVYNFRNGHDLSRTLIKLVEPESGFEDTVKLLEEE